MSLAITAILALNLVNPAVGVPAKDAARWSYLYQMADSHGPLAMNWAKMTYDVAAGELFAIDTANRSVRIFGKRGMQTFSLDDNSALGIVLDLASLSNGDLIVLSLSHGKQTILRCNFRGKPLKAITLKDVPAPVAKGFAPSRVVARYDHLYFIDPSRMRVVVTNAAGLHQRSYDLAQLLKFDDRQRADTGITGFDVDYAENLLFTIQPLFMAYVVSPEGKVQGFGGAGSRHGKFNVVGGITADEHGNYYVTDLLRGVVVIYDAQLKFRGEFGGGIAGFRSPRYVAAGNGHVFVSLGARRGIAAFKVSVSQINKSVTQKHLATLGVLGTVQQGRLHGSGSLYR